MPDVAVVNPTIVLAPAPVPPPAPKFVDCTHQAVPRQLNMLVASQPSSSKDADACPYSVLGLKPGATTKQIRRAHKRRIRFAASDESLRARLNSARDKALHIAAGQIVLPWCCLTQEQAECCPCSVNVEPDAPLTQHAKRDLMDILALTGFGEFVYLYPQSDYDMCEEDD